MQGFVIINERELLPLVNLKFIKKFAKRKIRVEFHGPQETIEYEYHTETERDQAFHRIMKDNQLSSNKFVKLGNAIVLAKNLKLVHGARVLGQGEHPHINVSRTGLPQFNITYDTIEEASYGLKALYSYLTLEKDATS